MEIIGQSVKENCYHGIISNEKWVNTSCQGSYCNSRVNNNAHVSGDVHFFSSIKIAHTEKSWLCALQQCKRVNQSNIIRVACMCCASVQNVRVTQPYLLLWQSTAYNHVSLYSVAYYPSNRFAHCSSIFRFVQQLVNSVEINGIPETNFVCIVHVAWRCAK